MFDLIREIGQGLNRNRTRTVLTGIAVVWGVFMLVALLGAARGVVNAMEFNLSQSSQLNIDVWGGRTNYAYEGYEAGRVIELDIKDKEPIKRNSSHYVEDVIPNASGWSDTLRLATDKDNISRELRGVFPEQQSLESMESLNGRFINKRDIDGCRRVMVLDNRACAQLFDTEEEAIGSRVRYAGLMWTVVGVYHHRWRRGVFVPYTTLKKLQGNSPSVSKYNVVTKNMHNFNDVQQVNQGIIATLARLHHFSETDQGAVWLNNRYENFLRSQEGMAILTTGVWVIGLLTLLSGIVGISNIMFVSVKERTHEIGIRRAIGAKPRSILASVICESVVITAMFGYIGIVFGMLLVAALDHFLPNNDILLNPGINLSMAFELTLTLVIAGAFAGLFPALKAIKINPVEALRDE